MTKKNENCSLIWLTPIIVIPYNSSMSIAQLLHSMCADLPDADLNFIRKARGFNANETASRSAFASFFVSSIGISAAMQSLSAEETVTLHLLHETSQVDVTFFERLYGSAAQPGKSYYGTYTQQYKSTFDTVKKNLVRRGIIVMAEAKMRGETVQMERWRFAIPPEFASYLPPLISSIRSDQPGETNDHFIRKELLHSLTGKPNAQIEIVRGSILISGHPFSTETLHNWQLLAWQRASNSFKPDIPASLDPVSAALSILGNLPSDQWVSNQSLEPVFKIYCFGGRIPPADKILHQGWETGLLTRLKTDFATLYRLAPEIDSADSPLPASVSWLEPAPQNGTVKIDLRLIPFGQLELLNALMHLSAENGALLASPSSIKLGRATPQQRNSPLSAWLSENIPAFGKAIQTINAQWGKTILHENLLVARVRDLSLRVQLERELKDNLILLNENFIAFPIESRASVEKVLKKTGFVVKTIKA